MIDASANSLVHGLAIGRPEAFADLYDLLGTSLFRVARRMLRNRTEAEDAVQTVFVELVKNRTRVAGAWDLDAYVFTMLRHSVARQIV